MHNKVDVIIPVYRPTQRFLKLLEMLDKQTRKADKIILINTEQKYFDELTEGKNLIDQYRNLVISHITKEEFDHGRTRNLGVSLSDSPFFIMMTDDAVPTDTMLVERLMKALEDPEVAVAYGRQVCGPDADPFEIYARSFNYPEESAIKSREDIPHLGIKTFFCSNVCAAYKKDVFTSLGGFASPTIFNEDMIYAANAIDHGYKVAYVADATVEHFHRYTNKQQFQRNFDLAVSQADHPEVFERVKSESEGVRYVKSQITYLWNHQMKRKIFPFIMQSGCKLLGYKLGKKYTKLPVWLVKKCSMNQEYWK